VSGVTPPSTCDTLAVGGSCTFAYTYTVQSGDTSPHVNVATAHYHPTGFATKTANAPNGGVFTFASDLVPRSYQVCEDVMPAGTRRCRRRCSFRTA